VTGHPVEVAGFSGVGVGQLGRVRGDGRKQLRVALQEVGRKQLGDQERFPQPGWTGDDQPAQLAIGNGLQQVDQHLGPAVEAVAGVGLSDEAASPQGSSSLCSSPPSVGACDVSTGAGIAVAVVLALMPLAPVA
jgi:hypothetical protein